MTLEHIWQRYRAEGLAGARETATRDAEEHFYLAVLAFAGDDVAGALASARTAARLEPGDVLFAAAATYLARIQAQGKAGVYVDGEAFAAFVRGGGNVPLYAAISAALRAVYDEYETLRLLDIGVGDGRALLPALTGAVAGLDLVEPSEAMLGRATAALDAQGVPCTAYNGTIQDFMARGGSDRWDVLQATWSLQSIPPAERTAIFGWLRAQGARVLLAEFDVPAFAEPLGPPRVRYVMDRYRRGLTEYSGDGGLVAQGFLMPVLFGYFDRGAARSNWEGPIQAWADGLRAAGFTTIQVRRLHAYFWADGCLVDAR